MSDKYSKQTPDLIISEITHVQLEINENKISISIDLIK